MRIHPFITNKLLQVKKTSLSIIRKTKKLLILNKDVFEKTTKNYKQTALHEGDTFSHIPNSITQQEDLSGVSALKIKFFKNDLEKMKNMSNEESLKYKKYLIEHRRYKL